MSVTITLNQIANFQDYTIIAPTGTTTADGITLSVNQATTTFPVATVSNPVRVMVYDPSNEASTREFMDITNKNDSTRALTVGARHLEGTLAIDHLNGHRLRVVLSSGLLQQIATALSDLAVAVNALQDMSSPTITVTAGEVYSATTTDPNGSGTGLSVTGPTLLYQASGTGKVLRSSTAAEESGGLEKYGVAAGASAGDGSIVQMYKPGTVVTGFTGLIPGQRYFPSAAVDGGWSTSFGTHWRIVGHAISATTMLLIEGKSSASLSAIGTPGTLPTNNGTNTRAARLDHEHRVINMVPWSTVDPPTTGDKQVPIIQGWPYAVEIFGFEFSTITAGSSVTIADVTWKTKANYYANTGSWVSIFNTPPQLGAGVRGVSSNSTSFAGGIATFAWSPDVVLKFELTTVGTGVGRCAMQLKLKAKNTN